MGKFWDKAWSLVEGCHGQGNWQGKVVREDRLDIPMRTRKPTVWAIWSDLRHATPAQMDDILEVIGACPQHTFLAITKGPKQVMERMYDFSPPDVPAPYLGGGDYIDNLWIIATVENQARLDERLPHLLGWPGKRGLIIEPMLGAVELRDVFWEATGNHRTLEGKRQIELKTSGSIHQVILGGETGPGARPMHPDWVRSVRDQCAAAGVPFYLKGWGAWKNEHRAETTIELNELTDNQRVAASGLGGHVLFTRGRDAGRLLDGREHNELAWRV